nr:Sensor histidine kinase QseE [Klebsiella pneumoniae]
MENVVAAHSLPARAKLMHTELTLQARRCWQSLRY